MIVKIVQLRKTKCISFLFFLVSNKLSEAMCNLIKALLDSEIVKPDIIIEKLPMNQLMNLVTSPVSIYLIDNNIFRIIIFNFFISIKCKYK